MPESKQSKQATTRVLIIDDNEAILKSVRLLLASKDFAVTTHNGSGDIVRYITAHPTDVIMLDYLLSGKSGAEIARQLHGDARTASIPIIAISAHPSAHLQMANEGVYAFVQKPFDGDTIIKKIEQALAKRQRQTSGV